MSDELYLGLNFLDRRPKIKIEKNDNGDKYLKLRVAMFLTNKKEVASETIYLNYCYSFASDLTIVDGLKENEDCFDDLLYEINDLIKDNYFENDEEKEDSIINLFYNILEAFEDYCGVQVLKFY